MRDTNFLDGDKGIPIKKETRQKNINRKLQTIKNILGVPLSASMTLEASIALPLFIFFFLNLMSSISIMRIQSELEASLHRTGSSLMQSAFDIRTGEDLVIEDDSDEMNILSSVSMKFVAAGEIKNSLKDKLDGSSVIDGAESLNFMSSHILDGDDIIDIVVDYNVHPAVSIPGFKSFLVESRFYGHAFTGYEISQKTENELAEEELVYITEHGAVYHKDIGCKHLAPSIKSVVFSEIEALRNNDGGKYYPCEYCGEKVAGGNVFVTEYGRRYHTRVNCPGLKRTIQTIPISEVGGRRPCSNCGG